MNQQKTRRSY